MRPPSQTLHLQMLWEADDPHRSLFLSHCQPSFPRWPDTVSGWTPRTLQYGAILKEHPCRRQLTKPTPLCQLRSFRRLKVKS
jgi:hypothetical protein